MPRELYEFPGYAYPDAEMKEISGKGFDKFPQGHEVAEYIRMFADDMKLQQLISFETSVTRLEPIAGRDGWAMHHGKQGEPEVVEQFDFVVVATGMCTRRTTCTSQRRKAWTTSRARSCTRASSRTRASAKAKASSS